MNEGYRGTQNSQGRSFSSAFILKDNKNKVIIIDKTYLHHEALFALKPSKVSYLPWSPLVYLLRQHFVLTECALLACPRQRFYQK